MLKNSLFVLGFLLPPYVLVVVVVVCVFNEAEGEWKCASRVLFDVGWEIVLQTEKKPAQQRSECVLPRERTNQPTTKVKK